MLDRLEHLPGVKSAGVINFLPHANFWGGPFAIEGISPLPPGPQGWEPLPVAWYRATEGDYFQAMGIRLIEGRYFTKQEEEAGAPVAIVNQTLAGHFFPGGNVLGRRLKFSESYLEIVGVVADIHEAWPWESGWDYAQYAIYEPLNHQYPTRPDYGIWGRLHTSFVVRAASNAAGLSTAVRNAIWEVDKDQPIEKVAGMKELISESDSQRFYVLVLGILAGVALLLATVGIYGVMSYSVGQRTHEIGVRRALGAGPPEILLSVMKEGVLLNLLGVGLGLVGALALTGFLSSLLYGLSPTDASTFAGITLLLMTVALVACYLPARRAMKVDPMVALRYE